LADAGADAGADLAAIRNNIGILFPPEQVIEVRAYSKHAASNYPFGRRCTDHDEAARLIKQLSARRRRGLPIPRWGLAACGSR
jgi:hypothetical protein